jgi:hypothetical protein
MFWTNGPSVDLLSYAKGGPMASNRNGFIAIDRKLLEWQWFSDQSVLKVWILCLLRANWKDGMFKGILVPRGSFITSVRHLSEDANLSPMTIRRCLKCLESTGEITHQSTHDYTIINVVKYKQYQNFISDSNTRNNKQPSTPPSTPPRHNRINKQSNNKRLDDDRDFYLNLYHVGFEEDPSVDELSKLEEMVSKNGYANVLSALKQSRKFHGEGIAYTISIMKNRKGKAKPFDPDRDISKVIDIISIEADQQGPDQKNELQAAAEDSKKYYTDYEMLMALRSCEVYNAFDAESFCKEIRSQFLERKDESFYG